MGRATALAVKPKFELNYIASPTAVAFHQSMAFVRVILGPVGSGKSVSAVMELFLLACSQPPNSQGIRQTRSLVVRSTFPELKTTSWRTFEDWLGPLGDVVFDSPIRFRANIPLPDGTSVDWEVLFYAIDGSDASHQKLRSLEISNCFINEGNNFSLDTLSVIKSRLGRFPAKKNGTGCARPCLLIDSNFGANDSPLKSLLETAPENHDFFIQPPAVYWDGINMRWIVNDYAENMMWLPDGYYSRMLAGMQADQIRMLLANQWVTPNAGKPVYPEFSTAHKFNGRIQHQPGRTIVVGMDFGLHVAAIFTQLTPTGQAVVLSEVWADDMDLDTFITTKLHPHVRERYPNSPIVICGDPAGSQRSALDGRSAHSALRKAGFEVVPSHSNDPETRIGHAKYFLNRTNGFYVSSECRRLIEGFEGAYGYERVAVATGSSLKHKDKPIKNNHSHCHDGLQYALAYLRFGRNATIAPSNWQHSRRAGAMSADAYARTGRATQVPLEMLQGLPMAQNPDEWGREAPKTATVQGIQYHEYV